ncbi:MAG: AtpZ/AtpI family protein [Elusimicrobia bacterium]|nr:AtpZ/AtpI family protein [Elusimicrobiota bacterium]
MGGLYHGLQFAVTAIGGLAVGYWLDQRCLPSPLGTLGGLFLGAVLGMYIMVREMR